MEFKIGQLKQAMNTALGQYCSEHCKINECDRCSLEAISDLFFLKLKAIKDKEESNA